MMTVVQKWKDAYSISGSKANRKYYVDDKKYVCM